jgi:hypothetical protein
MQYNLLTVSGDAKTIKGEKTGYKTAILYLSPERSIAQSLPEFEGVNLCPSATEGCAKACLQTAGRMRFTPAVNARARRTALYLTWPIEFFNQLHDDIMRFIAHSKRVGLRPCVRLNGTSDSPALAMRFAKQFPSVQMYDYTKIDKPWTRQRPNYHLTFSRSETNQTACLDALRNGVNVAVVFKQNPLPDLFWGYPVINGDANDLRFLDDSPSIVGLKAKGKARQDTTGFVII